MMLPSRAKGRGPTPAFETGARPWIPDCLIVRLPEALRMVFGDDAAPGFTLRRQRFVHLGHRSPLHHVLNACRVGAVCFDARSRSSIGNRY
ncbi:hypothetical protein QZM82_32965 [Burkholderia cepacia]|uniref:hypothetical protein n=1 Tax=Burkholderia cepacia TaxID=292 RepID=UPI0026506A46|nr:hypothetical protein [Burkholderia cepacia]MDN7901008.1 hypothetical protein [Burkholderia cepacia]